jgi:hypothetical protein
VVVNGSVPVDPASEMADSAHVLQEGKDIYNASLSRVDLREGINSYYKLQVRSPLGSFLLMWLDPDSQPHQRMLSVPILGPHRYIECQHDYHSHY